jgi:uncharacterized membrane protein
LSEVPTSGIVLADSSFPVDIHFTPAITYTAGVYTATLKVANDDPVGGVIEVPVTMNLVSYIVNMTADSLAKTGLPGAVVTYNVTVTNNSVGVSDSFDLTLSGNIFNTTLSATSTPVLNPGQSANVQVMVTVPASALAGAQDTVTVNAAFHNKLVHKGSLDLTTTAATVRAVDMTPATDAKEAPSGRTVTYTLHVENMGNIEDTFEFSTTGNTWLVDFSVPSLTLASGASGDVVVSVHIPLGLQSGASDVAVIHATSQGNPLISAQSTLTTSVHNLIYYIPLISRKDIDFPPIENQQP